MRTIRPYIAISRKDLKSVSALLAMTYVFALSYVVGDVLYLKLRIVLLIHFTQSSWKFMQNFKMTILFLFPVILTYSLNAEWLSGARYQRLSLPVRPSSLMLSKFIVVCIAASLLPFLMFYVYFLPWGPLVAWIAHQFYGVDVANLRPGRLKALGPLAPSWFDYLTIPFTKSFAPYYSEYSAIPICTILFSGLVCFAQAVSTLFRRFRFIAWVFAFLAGLTAYTVCLHTFSSFEFRHPYGFLVIGGLIFLAAGLVLFEKYAEV